MNLHELKEKLRLTTAEERIVPRRPERWNLYLKNLREAMGVRQVDFWAVFGVKAGTGSKYEKDPKTSDSNLWRTPPDQLMQRLVADLGLRWEETRRYGGVDKVTGEFIANQDGAEALELLDRHEVTLDDLGTWIYVHKYYRTR